MKRLSKVLLAMFLAMLMATLLPVQVYADSPDYISEVKVSAKNTDGLKGYTILSDSNGKAIDLNKKAGGGTGSKGDRAVYLGYKTTKKRSEAITDLAVMNMKGGYSVDDYDYLMEQQLKTQIIPFVETFLSAIKEYRQNYYSKNKENKKRADFTYKMLNYYIDDDTGKRLGELLLKETKFEMGDKAYNDLSDEDKKDHADILTIVAQSNGYATMTIENLLTRASDTSNDTWIERFAETDYFEMLKLTGKTPSDAGKELARKYDDDAQSIVEKWDDFYTELNNYKQAVKDVKAYDDSDLEDAAAQVDGLDGSEDEEEQEEVAENVEQAQADFSEAVKKAQLIAVYNRLEEIPYGDGTMLDFFLQPVSEIEDDITALYPLVASLSQGQRAGLDFVSLKELVMIAVTEANDYDNVDYSKMKDVSIYAGVNRAVYQKGGVALTTDALRKKALEKSKDLGDPSVSGFTIALIVISSVLLTATVAFAVAAAVYKVKSLLASSSYMALAPIARNNNIEMLTSSLIYKSNSALMAKIAKGFGVAAVFITAITISIYFWELSEFYEVDFTPIPLYMIDEKDMIGYTSKGDKIILNNQAAYYTAVECNRKEGDGHYGSVGNRADLNGDVGAQWLALYACKNEIEAPILADSLKVVIDDTEVPAGYKTGIHMFGSDTAFNLNTYPYDWNKSAPKIFVYFKTDTTKPKTTGSNFTAGSLALAGGGGLIIGASVSALSMKVTKKKKEKAQTV